MSSILKALKKLEHDKKGVKPEQLGIDARILQERSSSRFSRTALFLIAVALFLCGSGATYYYLKHTITIIADEAPRLQTPPLSHDEGSSMAQVPTLVSPAIVQGRSSQSPSAKPASSLSHGAQSRSTHIPLQSPHQPAQNTETTESQMLPTTNTAQPVAIPWPQLTVNGIAFQEGGSDNLAVINGATVSVGTMLEGVRVEDIQRDRVRFSRGSEKFEILLNKSSR